MGGTEMVCIFIYEIIKEKFFGTHKRLLSLLWVLLKG